LRYDEIFSRNQLSEQRVVCYVAAVCLMDHKVGTNNFRSASKTYKYFIIYFSYILMFIITTLLANMHCFT